MHGITEKKEELTQSSQRKREVTEKVEAESSRCSAARDWDRMTGRTERD
jgi:hypothetical protein